MRNSQIKLSQATPLSWGFLEEITLLLQLWERYWRLPAGYAVLWPALIYSSHCSFWFLFTACFLLPSPSLLLVPEHYQMSVLESAPVSSTVGRVVAKDLDEGINAEMKYSLVDGDGLDVFDINTDPNYQVGIITVRKVVKFPFYSNLYG